MTKRLFANGLFLYIVIILVSLMWLGRGYFFDETPADGRESFYGNINRHVPDDKNLAVAISGLSAPKDENVTAYGRTRIDSQYLIGKKKLATKTPNKSDKLQVAWLDQQYLTDCSHEDAIELRIDECTSPQYASELIEKNKVLLTRYIDLYQIPEWQGASDDENALMLQLNLLFSAQTKLLITQKKIEIAYQQWKNNHLFILHTLNQDLPFGSQISFQFAYRISLETLEHLIYKAPEILLTHDAELSSILKHQGLTNFNLKGMLRADYGLFNSVLSNVEKAEKTVNVERMRNRLYYFHLDYLKLAKLPAKESSKHFSEIVNKHKTSSDNRVVTFIKYFLPYGATDHLFNVMIMGSLLGFDGLIDEMHTNNAMSSLLKLRNQIDLQNVKEADVRAFLTSTSKDNYCPFTERPMAFDKKNKTLYCENPENKEQVAEVRLIF